MINHHAAERNSPGSITESVLDPIFEERRQVQIVLGNGAGPPTCFSARHTRPATRAKSRKRNLSRVESTARKVSDLASICAVIFVASSAILDRVPASK